MTSVLSLANLSKAFYGVPAVSDVSCSFKAGEIVGLVGKNGAGKSTLIRMIAGVISPDQGEIRVNGKVVALHSVQSAQRHGLGFVHQELNDIPILSIAENIFLGQGYPRRCGLIDRRALTDRAHKALALVGSSLDPTRSVASLSVAERRLVMIAAALARNARILILDEPTASLSDKEIDVFHGMLRKLRSEGLTILYVSHRLHEILSLTDRTMVMRDGVFRGFNRTKELDESALIHAITGHDVVAVREKGTSAARAKNASGSRLSLACAQLSPGKSFVSLDVRGGEIVGLAGLVGSGRTNVLQIIAGARPSRARLAIDNQPITLRSPSDALALGIACVPEDRRELGVFDAFTLTENITIGTLDRHRVMTHLPFPKRSSETETATTYIERLRIKTYNRDSRMRTLSGGNQQKAILARYLAANVRWLLLDEPTHGVDIDAKRQILDLMQELANAGVGIIYVCSEFQELLQVSTRIVVLREHELVATFDANAVTEAELLQCCYGGDYKRFVSVGPALVP